MMRHHSQKSIALFLSIVISFQSSSNGCSYEIYMNYEKLFDKDFMFDYKKKNTTYNAWYYNTELYDEENVKIQNAKSWTGFLENAYQLDAVKKFVYRSESKFTSQEKELLYLRAKRKKAAKNSQKEVQFVNFIIYALKVEKLLGTFVTDPWEDEPHEINVLDFSPLINFGITQLKTITDPFMKERYAFQLIKLYRYSKQYNSLISTFKNSFENRESMLSYWAMEHYAGVLSEIKKSDEANYYFTKVYVHCPEKRQSSYLSMKISSEADFNRTLNYCTTDEEKMALYYIHAMRTKSLALEDLKKITDNLGNHEYARMIMSHEINKLEKILLNRDKNNEDDDNMSDQMKSLMLLKNQVPSYLKDLIQLNLSLLSTDQEDSFWHLSLAYLFYLDGKHDACSKILAQIKPNSIKIQKQFDIIYIINYLETKKTLNETDENIIGLKLYSLNRNNPSYPELTSSITFEGGDYNTINEFIFHKITERYQYTNTFLKTIFSGEIFLYDLCIDAAQPISNTSPYQFKVKVEDIDKIITDLRRTPETKLALFAATYYFDEPDYKDDGKGVFETIDFTICEVILKELKATILLRNPANVDQSLEIYQTLPKAYLETRFVHGSPFYYTYKTQNFELFDFTEAQLPKMTRIAFAQKLKALLTGALTAENAYKLGLAYYNTSYYGLQWKLLTYKRFYSYPEGVVDMNVAEKFFNLALSLGGLDQEKQAEIYFMKARCEQNRHTLFSEDERYDDRNMWDAQHIPSFKSLKTTYRYTRAYQDIVRECKYFRYYLN